jgi:hypothetical protein
MPSDSFNSPAGYGGGGGGGGGGQMMGGGSGRDSGELAGGYGSSAGASWSGTQDPSHLAQASTLSMYIDAYQRYISRHISAHPSVFEPGAALKVISSNQRTPLAFQMYAVLANGTCPSPSSMPRQCASARSELLLL